MPRKKKVDPILAMIQEKLDEIHEDVKQVRTKDIPNLQVKVAVVEEKSKHSAKVVSAIGGIIAIATSAAIAMIR
jgi:F420-dependent methylenetetrahydromethanopterin dehydrogenase